MEVFAELNENKGIAVALGLFDGMHIGHRAIIQTLVQKAAAKECKSAVITFVKNPADYFNPSPTLNIQSFKDRDLILSSLGVDYLYELDFEKFKDLSADEYLENVIKKYFDPKIVVVGYNHTFGKDAQGNAQYLSDRGAALGYEPIIVSEQKYDGVEQVSSSIIRKKIENGELESVKVLLGRSFSVRNSVIKGKKLAGSLGYPTANIIWPDSMVKLPYGVYFGYCQTSSCVKPALISWGNKPTVTTGDEEILETHIYDFNENLYGKIVKVIFAKKFRDIQKFQDVQALKQQIKEDYKAFENWASTSKI